MVMDSTNKVLTVLARFDPPFCRSLNKSNDFFLLCLGLDQHTYSKYDTYTVIYVDDRITKWLENLTIRKG